MTELEFPRICNGIDADSMTTVAELMGAYKDFTGIPAKT